MLLSFLIWGSMFGGISLLVVGDDNPLRARIWALCVTLTIFALSLVMWWSFDPAQPAMQFQELYPWIPSWRIFYALGVDGFSMPLIVLTCFSSILVIIAGWEVIQQRPAQYMAAFLMMQSLMIGVFAALDAMLFYVFFEAMLIPMYLIIGIWGGPRRLYAAMKFFIYTFAGSIFMLFALLYLHNMSGGSFLIADFQLLKLKNTAQIALFFCFFVAFAVKVPMWPVHTWLPDAHVEAPTGGSVILAAITLKMGGYGFLRFILPILPDASAQLAWFVIALSLIAVLYIGLVALVQQDMKKLIAYSSIAHMGFVTLGIFLPFVMADHRGTAAQLAMNGAMVQMISHGLVSAAMFLSVGVLYDRLHSREIKDYGGVVNSMPIFAAFWVFFSMANAGLPATSGFVGEFMVILASMDTGFWVAFAAAMALILGASYNLWMTKRVIYGDAIHDSVKGLKDLSQREFILLGILALGILLFGLKPQLLTDVMQTTTDQLLQHITISKSGM